jgi:hypothetical protein
MVEPNPHADATEAADVPQNHNNRTVNKHSFNHNISYVEGQKKRQSKSANKLSGQ